MAIEKGGGILPLTAPYLLMSIDLGETTGIAVYDLFSRDLRHASTKDFHSLLPLIALFKPDELILERMPPAHAMDTQLEIMYRQLSTKCILISPSEWKPFMKVRKRQFNEVRTQHEKDAINMLRYYILIMFDEDIP